MNNHRGEDLEEKLDDFLESNDQFVIKDEMHIWGCMATVLMGYLVAGTAILRNVGMPLWVFHILGIAIYFLPLAAILYKIYQRGYIQLPSGVKYDGQLLRHGVLFVGFLEIMSLIWFLIIR